jgi:trehalose/maltose hydrolase-like predicted phosphorylase
VPFPADLMLGPDRLAASQIVKQADVIMAHHLVPECMAPGSLLPDLEHYLARTVHGSSLSPGVCAAVSARAGELDQALQLVELARCIDMDDLTRTTAAGLHLGALGGLWQALVFGFAGVRVLRPDDKALVVDPRIPPQWRELRLRLRWHCTPIALRCREDAVHVACSTPVRVKVGGDRAVVVAPPGKWVTLEDSVQSPRDGENDGG